MRTPTRLLTIVDLDEHDGGAVVADARVMSLSALHVAILADGDRLTLLDDRGWSASGPSDIWRHTSAEEITATARVVVGPDEPFGDHSRDDMVRGHWRQLAAVLTQHGIDVGADELSRLPHDVALSDRVLRRLAGA